MHRAYFISGSHALQNFKVDRYDVKAAISDVIAFVFGSFYNLDVERAKYFVATPITAN